MRIRTIKPSFWLNDELAELKPITRLLFIALWGLADVRGRLADRPKRIKVEAFPYDNVDVDECLSDLARAGFVLRYKVNGSGVIQVLNFEKHQRISGKEGETDSEFPEYDRDKHGEALGKQRGSTGEAPGKHWGSAREAPGIPGREGKGREWNRKGKDSASGSLTIPVSLASPEFQQAWEGWVAVRSGMKKPGNWSTMFQSQLDWLAQYDTKTAIGILSNSTRNGYQGLFEPKPNAHSSNTTPGNPRKNFTESADNARARVAQLESPGHDDWPDLPPSVDQPGLAHPTLPDGLPPSQGEKDGGLGLQICP